MNRPALSGFFIFTQSGGRGEVTPNVIRASARDVGQNMAQEETQPTQTADTAQKVNFPRFSKHFYITSFS